MTADPSPAQAEITRLLRVNHHQSELFERSRQFWLRAGRLALGGDDALLRHAILTAEDLPDTGPVDKLVRGVRIKHRQFTMRDLNQFVRSIEIDGADPDKVRTGKQMHALLIYILDELTAIEDRGELTF